MRYPSISRAGAYRASVPALSGGVNLVDDLGVVRDNQLTGCKNMWFKDGALRVRPAMLWQSQTSLPDQATLVYNEQITDGSGRAQYLAYKSSENNRAKLSIYAIYANGTIVSRFSISPCAYDSFSNLLLFYGAGCRGKGLFAVVGETGGEWSVWEYGDYGTGSGSYHWERLTEDMDEVYAPLVLINGKGDKYDELPASGASPYPNAVTFEGFNTLFGKFRAGFMADGLSMKFQLPCPIKTGTPLTVEYTSLKEDSSTWEIPADDDKSPTDTENGFYVSVDRETGILSFIRGQAETNLLFNNSRPNSIVVTAVAEPSGAPARMKKAVWFGGSSKGINGGSRLFLTGDPMQPGKVIWSDQGRPLYFPENCYAYVGENGTPVTAMAKQDNMLVFFKKDETYYTQFIDGPDYTAEDILSGAIVDVTTVDAVFPIYQIHATIGCDQPYSVQLCDNRLLWAHSNGHVYTLVSASIYSNANIYRLTEATGPLLSGPQNARSAIYDGWYYLFLGDHVAYVLDYRSAAVRGVSSYAKDRAPAGWYRWELFGPHPIAALSSEGGELLLIADHNGFGVSKITTGSFVDAVQDKSDGNYKGLTASFRTKLFDFSLPEKHKKIISLTAKVGGNGEMHISFVTERGQTPSVRRKELFTGKGPRDAGYLQSIQIMPAAARVRQFGVQMDIAGAVSVGSMAFYYKTLR